jgi:hypothetical protein
MANIGRLSLPAQFYDRTSDMLLLQPEPQYALAALFLDALGVTMSIPSGMGLNGREVMGVGAQYASVDSDRLKLAQALPRELFALTVDFNAAPGNTIRINRPAYKNSVYTEQSRRIPIGSTISTTGIAISSEQTNLTLYRYGGPCDDTGVVKPYAIEAFDANMGVHRMTAIVGNNLARDYWRFIESVLVAHGDRGAVLYVDGMNSDNDATTVDSFPFSLELVSRCEQDMDDSNLPTLPDGSRVLLLSPKQWKQLKHDPEYEAQAAYHREFALLFPNYVGSVGKFHLFKSTMLSKPANSSSVPVHRAIALAPGYFMGGMGRRPRVSSATDDNYGETAKVIWLADHAFEVADVRFGRSLRSA